MRRVSRKRQSSRPQELTPDSQSLESILVVCFCWRRKKENEDQQAKDDQNGIEWAGAFRGGGGPGAPLELPTSRGGGVQGRPRTPLQIPEAAHSAEALSDLGCRGGELQGK